ncbi:aminodeoxychorismate lyase [Halomonas almeriensis]|uniref:aminodeoxychorismate lyase n=1 Tax=Halomonas almeriensis TaxID=308163 RepID=UPI0025B4B7AC|nr:aminodeoxychorismate lyase [Halomonas almeriensis]MDN3552833.1 aminodeoxychorismate lyase [Halomonas almeriensis]
MSWQAEHIVADEGVPFDDRGLSYGDGLFETILVRDARPVLWDAHLARLSRGAERLGIAVPPRSMLDALPRQAGEGLRVLKLMLTRGSGGRGYQLPESPKPRLRWHASPFAPARTRWAEGVRVRHCELALGIQPRLAGLKHLNRLENVMARAEWQNPEVAEGLLCDSQGRLVEATCMNLVWQRDGCLETPELSRCGVAGTLRDALCQRLGIREVDACPEVLEQAEAVWIGNSVQGIWPVCQLDDTQGRALMHWRLDGRHRALQAEGHALLGYPVPGDSAASDHPPHGDSPT